MSEPESPTRRALFGALAGFTAIPLLVASDAAAEPMIYGAPFLRPDCELVNPAEYGVDLEDWAQRFAIWHQESAAFAARLTARGRDFVLNAALDSHWAPALIPLPAAGRSVALALMTHIGGAPGTLEEQFGTPENRLQDLADAFQQTVFDLHPIAVGIGVWPRLVRHPETDRVYIEVVAAFLTKETGWVSGNDEVRKTWIRGQKSAQIQRWHVEHLDESAQMATDAARFRAECAAAV